MTLDIRRCCRMRCLTEALFEKLREPQCMCLQERPDHSTTSSAEPAWSSRVEGHADFCAILTTYSSHQEHYDRRGGRIHPPETTASSLLTTLRSQCRRRIHSARPYFVVGLRYLGWQGHRSKAPCVEVTDFVWIKCNPDPWRWFGCWMPCGG